MENVPGYSLQHKMVEQPLHVFQESPNLGVPVDDKLRVCFFDARGLQKGFSYCCLYWYQAVLSAQKFKQAPANAGLSVMHIRGSFSFSIVIASSLRDNISGISWQHQDSSSLSIIWQWPHLHLRGVDKNGLTTSMYTRCSYKGALFYQDSWWYIFILHHIHNDTLC